MAKASSGLSTVFTSFLSYISPPEPGQDAEHPLDVKAVPGLATLLDVALFRSVEGQLTATACSSHALVWAFLDVKLQSQILLNSLVAEEESLTGTISSVAATRRLSAESFARSCLEAASDALERLVEEKLSQAANLSDPYESTSGESGGSHHHHNHHGNVLSGVGSQGVVSGVLEGREETGRRSPTQSRRDCWESPRLFCPDYVWADDAFSTCQRLLRNLSKHPFLNTQGEVDSLGVPLSSNSSGTNGRSSASSLGSLCERHAEVLQQLVKEDLPMRLYQFRVAMDAESVVTKRLYLVKCEYRAPFRAFLEAHQSVQRAPSMGLVDEYLRQRDKPHVLQQMRDNAKVKLRTLLETPHLIEALALEKRCEEMEIDLGRTMFPFSELARFLDHKRARLKIVPGVVEDQQDLSLLKETVRKLKYVMCRKGGSSETSQGIRPILLDLQGVPRDDEARFYAEWSISKVLESFRNESISTESARDADYNNVSVEERLDELVRQLHQLSSLCKTRNAFMKIDKKVDIDIPSSIVKGCNEFFDEELFRCQILDWCDMVQQQQQKMKPQCGDRNGDIKEEDIVPLHKLAEQIRRAEMEMSIAAAPDKSLEVVRKRLEMIATDRQKRFDVMKELIEEICVREMNLYVNLIAPDQKQTLELAETSAVGFLGIPLDMCGEPLPLA